MQKNVQFQLEEAIEIPKWADAYPEHKFTVFKTCFLSTKPNSHGLKISKNTLQECAKTILGNFLVAKLEWGDATTHKDDEAIWGYYPMEQEIEFIEDGDVLKAYAYAVVSKRYSKEFNGIFEIDNIRNSSVEMTVVSPEEDEDQVDSFDIYGLTCLGRTIKGSCPDADITMVRFAKEDAENYFKDKKVVTTLEKFMKERNQSMAKSYKIDKSKEAMSERAWGDVDKTEMRNKIMEADNKSKLVKAVYMLVEDGWEDAPSEHLKYPVMELKGDTFVYNRYGLSSALAYARQEGEQSVINKVEKIYKSLDIDDSDGKEEKKMSEINTTFAEEEKEKDTQLEAEENEENIKELAEVEKEEEKLDDEKGEDSSEGQSKEAKMSEDDMIAKIAEHEQCIEEKENIIMEKDKAINDRDAELEVLRKFKQDTEDKEKAMSVEAIMSEMVKFMDAETAENFRKEGLAVEFAELDAWANKVKASVVDKVMNSKSKKTDDVFSFAAPVEKVKERPVSVWDRL